MPFTPAHTAIIFPARWLKPQFISWTALIIGTMIPDAEYFLWMDSASLISHSFSGILLFNLPMTFLVAFAWHSFIAKGLLPYFPFLKSKYYNSGIYDFPSWLKKNWIVFTISAIIGIISHLVWDSFCHSKGFMVLRIPALLEFVNVAGHPIRLCYVLWYLSTLFGLLLISIWIINFKSIVKSSSWKILFTKDLFWGKIIAVAALLATTRIAMGLNHNVSRHLVIITISSILYAIVIIAFIRRKRKINF